MIQDGPIIKDKAGNRWRDKYLQNFTALAISIKTNMNLKWMPQNYSNITLSASTPTFAGDSRNIKMLRCPYTYTHIQPQYPMNNHSIVNFVVCNIILKHDYKTVYFFPNLLIRLTWRLSGWLTIRGEVVVGIQWMMMRREEVHCSSQYHTGTGWLSHPSLREGVIFTFLWFKLDGVARW